MRKEKCFRVQYPIKAALLFLLCPVHAALADIYMVQNADGQIHFTNSVIHQRGYQVFIAESKHVDINLKRDVSQSFSERKRSTIQLIQNTAHKYALDPALITAIIAIESGFDPEARSSKGALGLMQLMPATARQYGVFNLRNPSENITAGTQHFKKLVDTHNGNIALALAAYNAGDGSIKKNAKRIPPYPETMLYVSKVLAFYERYRADTAN